MTRTRNILETAQTLKAMAASLSPEQKNTALAAMADALVADTNTILVENRKDVEASTGVLSAAMIDRLALTPERIAAMAEGLRNLIALEDPNGRILEERIMANGLKISKVTVPFGVIAIIYESRPNVTSDAAGLALKSGNVCVLRCGKEAYRSAAAVVAALQKGLMFVNLPEKLVQLAESSRETSMEIMQAKGFVDLLIPRGGAGLISACMDNARVPVIQTGTGICHMYVHSSADPDMAVNIVENAKLSRPSVCNALEVCLVDAAIADTFLPLLAKRLDGRAELRLDTRAAAVVSGTPAGPDDFDTEFLDTVLAVSVVDGIDAATLHIARHSTHHSDGIIASDDSAVMKFVSTVDSAAVYVNASTRYTDGGEFGLGCEMGISTQKLHARGPMGLRELTSYKYIVRGSGQIR